MLLLLRFLASSALATMTIALVAVVLAWATWIESRFGTAAVQFGIYQSAWFAVLLGVLGINVFAAAAVRFPWRRKQIGFLIVHAGILVLLVGCWISRQRGVDARLILYEGDSASEAMTDARQFLLSVRSIETAGHGPSSDDAASQTPAETAAAAPPSPMQTMEIPFTPGPFNWRDYDRLAWFPWRWAHRDRGILYDRDGVRLEVLDYCSDSRLAAGGEVVPVHFERDKTLRQERVRVRLTGDGNRREFWRADPFADDPGERFGGARGERHVAMVRIDRPAIALGFRVHLDEFECRYDPGTSRPSHFQSRVDFLTADDQARPLEKNVLIGPNRPARFTDPASGRTFRFFQTSFDGPYVPEQLADIKANRNGKKRDRIYRSELTAAYDPGRQWKYAGCLMILSGIVVMYYMKAYFFRARKA